MDIVGDIFTEAAMAANLDDQICHLKHSEEDPAEDHPAVNYLCQCLGDQSIGETMDVLAIPICAECEAALFDDNWVLLYCVRCNSSQWIYKPLAKRNYEQGQHVMFMTMCPNCYGKEDDEIN